MARDPTPRLAVMLARWAPDELEEFIQAAHDEADADPFAVGVPEEDADAAEEAQRIAVEQAWRLNDIVALLAAGVPPGRIVDSPFSGVCDSATLDAGDVPPRRLPPLSEKEAMAAIFEFIAEEDLRRGEPIEILPPEPEGDSEPPEPEQPADGEPTPDPEQQAKPSEPSVFAFPPAISAEEWEAAELSPPCIVDKLLWSDVAVRIAPGGMGKTTLELFEAVHIALGRPLFGLEVRRPGSVLLVTAEDWRGILVARLREICRALELRPAELALIRQQIRIADLSATAAKKLTMVDGDVVIPNGRVDEIIDACRESPPALIVFDPAISFGVGERRVNDAEQALIEAARRIRGALGCAVKYVHHSGQASARDKLIDQYAGRGGSAFADGCRMVHVLQSLSPEEFDKATGRSLQEGETGLILARPKLSYCPPQPPLYLVRRGYLFRAVEADARDPGAELAAICNQVLQLIREELRAGRYPTQRGLEAIAKQCSLTRQQVRDAVATLKAAGRIETRQAPESVGWGGRRDYLAPFGAPDADGAASAGA